MLPVVLYGCETWSPPLREEHRLRVLENRVLRKIFGPKRDDVTDDWRKLHNEELNDLYCSPNIVLVIKSRRMRWAGNVARMGERTSVYMVLMGEPEGRRPLGRHRHRWEDNMKMDLQEVGWGSSIWLRKGTGGGHLWLWWWNFGFHKMRGISWLAEKLLAFQEGLCSMELRIEI
jgi:hypothetical protein